MPNGWFARLQRARPFIDEAARERRQQATVVSMYDPDS
jgi:hypothetical protein